MEEAHVVRLAKSFLISQASNRMRIVELTWNEWTHDGWAKSGRQDTGNKREDGHEGHPTNFSQHHRHWRDRMRILVLPNETAGYGQHGQVADKLNDTDSKDRKKNRLELKTARDGPTLTYWSHVLEAVMLKAANERVKRLSRTKTTKISRSEKDRNGESERSHTKYNKSQQQEGAAYQLGNFGLRVHRWIHYGRKNERGCRER